MRKYFLLIHCAVIFLLFSGIVMASNTDKTDDPKDIIKNIKDIKDLFDLLDMVKKNKEDLNYQLEDPTNQTRMTDNVENTINRGVNLLFGVDPRDTDALTERVESMAYILVSVAFFLAIITVIFGKK